MSAELREVQGRSARLEISDWKVLDRGALKGTFSVTLPSGMILRECTAFQKGEKRWICGPQRQFRVGETTKYTPLIDFADRAIRDRFNEAVLRALDELLQENR